MANKVTSILLILFFIAGKVHCNYEKITYMLATYEFTNSTDVNPRRVKSQDGIEKSIQLKAFGKIFVLDLTLHFPRQDSGVEYISKLRNFTDSFLGSDLELHYGYVRGVNSSYVIGSFAYGKYFKGYVFTDEVYCIEPHGHEGSLIVYRFKDVIVPGCSTMSEDRHLDCSETKYFVPWKANEPPKKRIIFPNYSLFYDKHFEILNSLRSAKSASNGRKANKGKTVKRRSDADYSIERNKNEREPEEHHEGKVGEYTKVKHRPSNLEYYRSQILSSDVRKDYLQVDSENSINEEEHRKNDPNIYPLIMKALEEEETPAQELQCDVEVVVGPSLVSRFGGRNDDLLKDIFTQFTLLNRILRKVTYSAADATFRISLTVNDVVMYADEVYSPFREDGSLEHFSKTHRQKGKPCLSIGLVNQFLMSGQLFDGYIPEGGGGACSSGGNTLIVSYGSDRTPAPMGLSFAALVRGVTRALGANDRDPECEAGTYPNPMLVLQGYLVDERIDTSVKEYSIFTACNVREITKAVGNMKECFSDVADPLCGNGVVDEGEECDCGPAYYCDRVDPCCNPPVLRSKKTDKRPGCTLVEGARCGSAQECCSSCQVEKRKNAACFNGNGVCDIATCDGESADCPSGAVASDGMVCSFSSPHRNGTAASEPMLCRDNECGLPLCTGHGLQPCTCAPGTGRDCSHCCATKEGKCRTAGPELTVIPDRDFFLPDGSPCTGGVCVAGQCVDDMQQLVNYSAPPMLPANVNGGGRLTALNCAVVAASLLRSLVVVLFLSSF